MRTGKVVSKEKEVRERDGGIHGRQYLTAPKEAKELY